MAGEKPHTGLHARVSGRVQGVAFRAATRAEARRLGLTGWVRNLHDGRVELQAFGPHEKLEELRAWLKHGPPMAHVLKLDCKPVEYAAHADFAILETG